MFFLIWVNVMNKIRFSIQLLILLLFFYSTTSISATLSGIIYGGSNPLENTVVKIYETGDSTSLAEFTTLSDGTYNFDLSDGQYDLLVETPDDSEYGSSNVNNIVINSNDITQDVSLIKKSYTISGQITLPDGTPMVGTKFFAIDYNDASLSYPEVLTDQNGNYTYSLNKGSYKFNIRNTVYNNPKIIGSYYYYQLSEEYVISSDTTMNIELPMSKVSGKTVDQSNSSISNVAIGYKSYENISTLTTHGSAKG